MMPDAPLALKRNCSLSWFSAFPLWGNKGFAHCAGKIPARWLSMKLRVLLCGAALMLVAGCASEQNPFAGSAEQVYNYDLVPQPLPDLTPTEVDRIYQNSTGSYSAASNPNGLSQDISGR
jgi:hypothetical protein